ncbi:molybdenum cofactor guanylyltransferase [Brevibacterium metallidurans]|uniref:MobA-like NTP transferase domain-containing protein n=1 Tax=Brevibacterium metallidurans TaxID=1482676 RepID=A0ABN0SIJ6_9MICO
MSITVMILSGGRSSRFGGVHKPGVRLGEQTVISRILTTVRAALPEAEVWVAGPTDGLTDAEAGSVRSVREVPEFSGPLAGIDAVVRAMGEAETTVILAGDMPLIPAAHLRDLVTASTESGLPAAGSDDRGKLQFLCAAWPTSLLIDRLDDIGETKDRAVRLLFDGLEVTPVDIDPSEVVDFDTREEYERIARRLSEADGAPVGGFAGEDGAAVGSAADTGGGTVDTEGVRSARRPVPAEVMRVRELAGTELAGAELAISEADVAAVLEFASHIKHSDSTVSPVVAAFLAGRLRADYPDTSIAEALARVEEALTRPDGGESPARS